MEQPVTGVVGLHDGVRRALASRRADRDVDGLPDGEGVRTVENASVAVRPPLRDPEPAVVAVAAAADDAETATTAVVAAGRELAAVVAPLTCPRPNHGPGGHSDDGKTERSNGGEDRTFERR